MPWLDRVDEVARARGVSRDEVVAAARVAFEAEARRVLGEGRGLEAALDPDVAELRLYLVVEVVEVLPWRGREVSLLEARAIDPSIAVGESLLFMLFDRPGEEAMERELEGSHGDLLGLDDAFRERFAVWIGMRSQAALAALADLPRAGS